MCLHLKKCTSLKVDEIMPTFNNNNNKNLSGMCVFICVTMRVKIRGQPRVSFLHRSLTLFIETGTFTETWTHWCWLGHSRVPAVPAFTRPGSQVCATHSNSLRGAEDMTLVLILPWKAFYRLSHFSRLKLFFIWKVFFPFYNYGGIVIITPLLCKTAQKLDGVFR